MLLVALTRCQTTGSSEKIKPDAVRVACESFEPIYWRERDSLETIKAVKEHNAVYRALCLAAPLPTK